MRDDAGIPVDLRHSIDLEHLQSSRMYSDLAIVKMIAPDACSNPIMERFPKSGETIKVLSKIMKFAKMHLIQQADIKPLSEDFGRNSNFSEQF